MADEEKAGPRRRLLPVAVLALVAVVVGAAYLYRDTVAGLLGLGGSAPASLGPSPAGPQPAGEGQPAAPAMDEDPAAVAPEPASAGDAAPRGSDLLALDPDTDPADPDSTGEGILPGEADGDGPASPTAGGEVPNPEATVAAAETPGREGTGEHEGGRPVAAGADAPAAEGGSFQPPDAGEGRETDRPPAFPSGSGGVDRSDPPREASRSGLGAVTDLRWVGEEQGTRVIVELDSPPEPGSWEHNPLDYDGRVQMLELVGFENYPKSDLRIGSAQVRGVRLGYHPGNRLRLVFDLQDPAVRAAEVGARGNRLEILFVSPR